MRRSNTALDTPSIEGKGSPFFYSRHAGLLNLAHKALGYSRNETMCLQSALVQWWENDRMPFPSEALVAGREQVSERTVRRWKSKAKALGHLRLIPRYQHGRRTSDVWDFSGLIAALDAYAEAHPNPYAMPEPVPKKPRAKRPKLADIEGKLTGQIRPTKCQKPLITISPPETPSPPGDLHQDEIPLALNAEREAGGVVGVVTDEENRSADPGEESAGKTPQTGARSSEQTSEPRLTLVERRAKAEQAIAGAKAKSEKTHRERVAKAAAEPSYAEKKAQAQKAAATGPKAQLKANVNTVNTAWKKAMEEFHPDGPRERSLSLPHRQILINLIDAWGVEDASKLMRFSAEHWGALKSQFKNRLDDSPTLGFIQNYSQKLMQQIRLLEKYESLVGATGNLDTYGPNSTSDELNSVFNRLKELYLK